MEHRDSTGGRGVIAPGGVQWMTAGAGVVHSEMPTPEILRDGGRVHGFQLWVNLRAADKMISPRYQGYGPAELGIEHTPGGSTVRVVAGVVGGATGPVATTSPVTYAHVSVAAGDTVVWSAEAGHTALVHVFGGSVDVNGQAAGDGTMVVLERLAGEVSVTGGPGGAEVLLLGGEPLREPIARYGPFVMNARAEIVQAFEDYEAGRLGTIAPVDLHPG
jgi:quercetin 2,3-dioxygenase